MNKVQLGASDLHVTPICMGTMTFGEQVDEATAHAILDRSFERGVNFLDTAEMYSVPARAETFGATETIIGNWFAKNPAARSKLVLATKVAGPARGMSWIREGSPDLTAADITQACNHSLKRLKTDVIDLYQIHWPARHVPAFGMLYFEPAKDKAVSSIHQQLEALGGLVKAGKVRAVGLSNETAWGTQKYLTLSEHKGLPRVASIQNEYSLLYRHFDLDMAELSHHEDVGLLAYSPLAAGLLTGKYLDGVRPEGSRATINGDLGGRLQPLQEAPTRACVEIAARHGLDPAAMALAFCLTRRFMTSVIIGATTMEQLKVDLSAVEVKLSSDVLSEIEKVHRQYPMPL